MYPLAHRRRNRLRLVGALSAALAIIPAFTGCKNEKAADNAALKVRYKDLGPKEEVPAFMKGTVWEMTERTNDEYFASSIYGLVGRLRGTGDCTASLQVREWIIKQMIRHGYGNKLLPGYDKIGAGEILRNPGYSVVRVDGQIPPGARKGDFFDVTVTALPGNKTSSLTGGILFESDLTALRGNSPDIDSIHTLAKAKGPIVVNPAYALTDPTDPSATAGQAKKSLRGGTIMDGGLVMNDRAIILRLRQPSRPLARRIEQRINHRFQAEADRPRRSSFPITYQAAAAMDEGLVEVYVPAAYRGDWEHFIGVCEQLYLVDSPANLIAKAKELTEEAVKPGAPLLEISYGLEGIGEPALQYILPLMAHPAPDVSFAMARAAVFIDRSGAAQDTLLRIARSDNHQFQLAAIDALGALPSSSERNQKLRDLLESKNTLARTAAYKVLSRNKDTAMSSRVIGEKFALDIVPSGGDPLVFASRSGIPRIAIMGPKPQLALPLIFTTLNGRLMIASTDDNKYVTIFYRDDVAGEPIKMLSRSDIAEIIARLGGSGAREEAKFEFTYGEIVAIVQLLTDQEKIVANVTGGKLKLAEFVFEKPRRSGEFDDAAPVIEDTRPNTADTTSTTEPALPAPRVATK
jgi:hypothetical protein